MMQSRRTFMTRSAAIAGAVTILPFGARAEGHGGDVFETNAGPITVHPIKHASFVMETPAGTIYVDPVGSKNSYDGLPAPDLILVTHEHSDHYKPATLSSLIAADSAAQIIANPAVQTMLPEGLAARSSSLENGDSIKTAGVTISAIPAYNTTDDRKRFHPKGRDNGYVVTIPGFRIYISGDTEDIPEMRALTDIDLAFVCMNLPYTMDVAQAASAVAEFKPTYVYPYHYRGSDGGTQDPAEFSALIGDRADVRIGAWYG